MKIKGAKWGTNFLKGIFLGGNFGEHVLEDADSFGEDILPATFLPRISCEHVEAVHLGKKKNTGKQKCTLEETYGEQKSLRANCFL